MATFFRTSVNTLVAVSELVDRVDGRVDVHTITLELNGQHGEFDVRIQATDGDMEDVEFTAIAHRTGGLTDIQQVKP